MAISLLQVCAASAAAGVERAFVGSRPLRERISQHTRSIAQSRTFADDLEKLRNATHASTAVYRFPQRLEREFQAHVRLSVANARIFASLLIFCLFAAAQFWCQ